MAKTYDKMSRTERAAVRMAVPVGILVLILLLWTYPLFGVRNLVSVRVFFDISESTEWVTFLLLLLYLYMVFEPIIVTFILSSDHVVVNDTNDTLIIKSDSNNVFVPVTLPHDQTTSVKFLDRLRGRLSSMNIDLSFDSRSSRFVFRSQYGITIDRTSKMLSLLGFPTQSDSDFVSTPKEIKLVPSTTCCTLSELQSVSRVRINDPNVRSTDTIINTSNIENKITIYVVTFFIIATWKYFSVKSYRAIGKGLDTDRITDSNINSIRGVQRVYNMWGFLIALGIVIYIGYIISTDKDLLPYQDI